MEADGNGISWLGEKVYSCWLHADELVLLKTMENEFKRLFFRVEVKVTKELQSSFFERQL